MHRCATRILYICPHIRGRNRIETQIGVERAKESEIGMELWKEEACAMQKEIVQDELHFTRYNGQFFTFLCLNSLVKLQGV